MQTRRSEKAKLSEFVMRSMRAGATKESIRGDMISSGWSERDADEALGEWQPGSSGIPVPRPERSAFDAPFLPLLLITLVGVLWGTIQSTFSIVDHAFFDPALSAAYHYARWPASLLIVLTPCLLYLDRKARGEESGVMTSVILGVLSSASFVTIAGSLVATMHGLLSGDVTARFLAKVLVVCTISALVIGYRRNFRDPAARGRFARVWSGIASCCVAFTLIVNGGWTQGRLERDDQIRMNDIWSISERMRCLSRQEDGFFGDLSETALCPGTINLTDPDGTPYRIVESGQDQYQVCADMKSRIHRNQPCSDVDLRTR